MTTETLTSLFLVVIGVYLAAGVLAYFPLLKKGIPSLDDSMHDTSLFFKILLFPGIVALWLPLLLKWQKNARKS